MNDDETDLTKGDLAEMWEQAEPALVATAPSFVRVVTSAIHEPMFALTTVESIAVTQVRRREHVPVAADR